MKTDFEIFRLLGNPNSRNTELDALSRMVVDKVLEKIKGEKATKAAVCDDKTGMAVTQMRQLLQRERNLVSELQVRVPMFNVKNHAMVLLT